jgi:hypothetical protein
MENSFVSTALNRTMSNEGSLKYKTSGDPFVDNFFAIARFKQPRSYEEVANDMELLWNIDKVLCVKLAFYIRLISRNVKVNNYDEDPSKCLTFKSKGQGLKHEGIMRFIWIALNHKDLFDELFPFIVYSGSWKDIFTMYILEDKLDIDILMKNIIRAIRCDRNMILKYLPRIRSKSHCTTKEAEAKSNLAKTIAKKLGLTPKQYRKLKVSGFGHEWQQQISTQKYNEIDFNKIPGKALTLLANSQFFSNHNLFDKYKEWLSGRSSVNCTSYVYELFSAVEAANHIDDLLIETVNKQFQTLLGNTKLESKLLVVRDISGSMTSRAVGCNCSSHCIATSMALFFSKFLTGAFADCYLDFSKNVTLNKVIEGTYWEQFMDMYQKNEFASTEILNVLNYLISLKDEGVPEEDFPEGLLIISDGEFAGLNTETVYQTFKRTLSSHFSQSFVDNFKFIIWDIPNYFYGNSSIKFEGNDTNLIHISGYDASIVSVLLESGSFNGRDVMLRALDQDLLNMIGSLVS